MPLVHGDVGALVLGLGGGRGHDGVGVVADLAGGVEHGARAGDAVGVLKKILNALG